MRRAVPEEVGVEREDDVGLVERVPRVDVLAEREPRRAPRAVAVTGSY